MNPYSELLGILKDKNTNETIFNAKVLSVSPFAVSIDNLRIENVLYNADVNFEVGDMVLVIAPKDYTMFFAVCRLGGEVDV